jgi:hypothetical protein
MAPLLLVTLVVTVAALAGVATAAVGRRAAARSLGAARSRPVRR